jgi:two-component system sensor histidine kinase UhpB
MSLRSRLIGLVCLALLVSLALGGVIAWVNASRSVRTEMRSALLVARQTVEAAIDELQNASEPSGKVDELVASFEGNRHLRVRFIGEAQMVAAPVVDTPAFASVPGWFVHLVGVSPATERVAINLGGRDYGTIAIETDPHNEILEVWNELTQSLVAPAVFCGLTILLIYVFVGRALRPLEALALAMEQVGDGRYRTHVGGRLAPELSRLRDSFNAMALRLAEADAENRRLHGQLLNLQEQERADLARDLHDEVSPFLFAINIDAAAASRLLKAGGTVEAEAHIQSITEAVRYMQRQVRGMLGRLRPIGLAEFGVQEAIENTIAFWRRRRPDIRYQLAIATRCEGFGELVSTTICRIVQECLSNAVRHADPGSIAVLIERDGEDVKVEVTDDGRGRSGSSGLGYGLLGLSERVRAVGGRLNFANGSNKGFAVTAVLPCSASASVPV